MSGKRRDSKNRILRNGESQRQDGRYAFKYMGDTGKQQFVYSWKLEKTDKTPQGKRDDLSLREKEKLILKDIDDAIVPRGGEMTVLELVKKYLLQKTGVRHNTEANYNFVVNVIKKEEFGRKRIDKVKLSDAKCWLIKLQQDGRGLKYMRVFSESSQTCEKYSSIYKVQMPKVTPHVCRHTFCFNMSKSGMNPKILQYLVGHSDIGVTLSTYTHIGYDDAKEELKRMAKAE